MPFAAIKTDLIDGSDRITPSTTDIFINGQKAILNGDDVSSHGTHVGTIKVQVVHGTNTFGNDKLMASLADKADCDHGITKGPNNKEDVTIET